MRRTSTTRASPATSLRGLAVLPTLIFKLEFAPQQTARIIRDSLHPLLDGLLMFIAGIAVVTCAQTHGARLLLGLLVVLLQGLIHFLLELLLCLLVRLTCCRLRLRILVGA